MDPLSDVLSLLKPRSDKAEALMRVETSASGSRSMKASNATRWFRASAGSARKG